jgi:two-component system cell cycle sensor histidine kinase/response regulator CckA
MLHPGSFSRIKALFARVCGKTSWTTPQVATRTSAQERLSPSKQRRLAERYRVLVENAPVGIHEIDRRRTLSVVNRAGLRMLGRTESVFGVPVLDVVSPADRPRIGRLLDLAFAGEFCEFEFTSLGERTFLSCFMPLKDEDGAIYKVLGMSQDITHRKNAEVRLNQAQKMEALGKLAGGIAHDFNNTLNVIVGYAHLLQQGPTPEQVQEHTTEVLKVAQQASALTRQLLAFSRKQVVQPQTVDLNTVIERVTTMLRRLIHEDIEICIRLTSDLPSITTDAGQTEQIIVNLAVNARDAMPAGGRLTIATSTTDLDNAHACRLGLTAGTYVVLSVSDDGHGMNTETQAHIFEPFFTTKEAGKGTGLGLATVHAIVMQNSGHISVDSRVGEGTAFTVYFPASTTSAATVKRSPVLRPTVAAAETILLVEDEQGLRKLMKELLRAEGYTVIESADGLSAIETSKAYTGTIHLLLTDVIMPRMHGHELAMRLRQQRPGLKVLYITGDADPGTWQGGRVLEKPFMPEALLREIHNLLSSPDKFTTVRAGVDR